MTLVYSELGYTLRIDDIMHSSALYAANAGELDGQLGRVASVGEQYKNLIRIDVPIFKFNLQLFSLCTDCRYQDYRSIVIQAGYPAAKDYINSHPSNAYIIEVKNVISQLNLVMQKKVDAALLLDFHLNQHISKLDLEQMQISNILAVEAFHFIHKRHRDLVPKVKAKLQEFSQNGLMAKLKTKYQI